MIGSGTPVNWSDIALPNSPYCYNGISGTSIMQSLGDQFLDMILRISLMFLALGLVSFWVTQDWEIDGWGEFNEMDPQQKKMRIMKTVSNICLVPSMAMPALIILYKLGVPL